MMSLIDQYALTGTAFVEIAMAVALLEFLANLECLRTIYSFLADGWPKQRYRRWISVLLAVAAVCKVGI